MLLLKLLAYLNYCIAESFFFIAVTIRKVLMLLSHADKALQRHTCDVTNAFSLVETTIDLLKGMRSDIDGTFELISAAVEDALEENEESTESPNKRQRNLPSTFNDSIVYSTVLHTDASSTATTNQQSVRVLLIEILDNTIGEMKERFSERNISLLSALSHLSPAKQNFLSPADLKSFAVLIECEVNDSFTSECKIAKSYILRQINSIRYANPTIVQEICELISYPKCFSIDV